MKLTLSRYIFKEVCTIFFVSLLVFIFIIMTTEIIKITELIINQRFHLSQVLIIILSILPRIIIFSLPATCLMCVLLTFLRLSTDNEVIALNASGISLFQMLPSVILFSSVSLIFALFISIYAIPLGNSSYKKVLYRVIESKADVTIKERIFYEPFNDVGFYVNSFYAKERTMKDLFVVDKRGVPITNTIIAKEGKILSNPKSKIVTIYFRDGIVSTVGKGFKTASITVFDSYVLKIDLNEILASMVSQEKEPKEMSISELINHLAESKTDPLKYNRIGIELFEMFSIPIAIFLLGIIGAPLGANVRSRGRSLGIILSLIIFLLYYISLMIVRYICEMGALNPAIGVWLPDLFLLISCLYLLLRVGNDRHITLFEKLSSR